MHQQTFAGLAADLLRRGGTTRVVAIDGGGGSGKSVFAVRLAEALVPMAETALVPVDDFYRPADSRADGPFDSRGTLEPQGLFDLKRLRSEVLAPYQSGGAVAHHPFDWGIQRVSTEARWVGRPEVLIIEGVFALSEALGVSDAFGIWVDAPEEVRLARGLARDGESARDTWLTSWLPREEAYRRHERPDLRADVVVDTATPTTSDSFWCRRKCHSRR